MVVSGSFHRYGVAQAPGRARRTLREAKKEGKKDEREELKSSGCWRSGVNFPLPVRAITTQRTPLSLRFARENVEPALLPLELGLVVHLLVDGGPADCLRIAKFLYNYREMTTSLLNFQYRTPQKATAPSLSPISSTKTSSKVCRPIPLQKAESASFPLMYWAMVVVLIHPRTVCSKKSLSI